MADVSQIEVNGTTYDICDATARDSLSQYLPLTGGTVSGDLLVKDDVIDRNGANPSAYQYGNSLSFSDKDNETIGVVRTDRNTEGSIITKLMAINEKSDGTQIYNVLDLYIDKDNKRKVAVTDQEA